MSRLSEHLLHLQCRLPLPDLQVFFLVLFTRRSPVFMPKNPGF